MATVWLGKETDFCYVMGFFLIMTLIELWFRIIRNILTVLIYSGMFGNDINVIAMGGRLKCKTIHGPVLYLCSRNGLLSLNLSLDCIIRFGIANTTNL